MPGTIPAGSAARAAQQATACDYSLVQCDIFKLPSPSPFPGGRGDLGPCKSDDLRQVLIPEVTAIYRWLAELPAARPAAARLWEHCRNALRRPRPSRSRRGRRIGPARPTLVASGADCRALAAFFAIRRPAWDVFPFARIGASTSTNHRRPPVRLHARHRRKGSPQTLVCTRPRRPTSGGSNNSKAIGSRSKSWRRFPPRRVSPRPSQVGHRPRDKKPKRQERVRGSDPMPHPFLLNFAASDACLENTGRKLPQPPGHNHFPFPKRSQRDDKSDRSGSVEPSVPGVRRGPIAFQPSVHFDACLCRHPGAAEPAGSTAGNSPPQLPRPKSSASSPPPRPPRNRPARATVRSLTAACSRARRPRVMRPTIRRRHADQRAANRYPGHGQRCPAGSDRRPAGDQHRRPAARRERGA